MKVVYVVRGSEDGNIGVYGNVKKAYEKCLDYLQNHEVKTTYNQALKGCRSWGCEIECSDDYVTCTIETFYFNQI